YIYSDAKGSGKTMMANAICGSICAKYNMAARFTKAEDFLVDVKKSYDSRSKDEMIKNNIQKYYDAELLVLDDLGVSKITEWGQGVLHDLINERYKANKLCIITSNYVPDKLPVHAATVDRINDMCLVLHFPEVPIRSKKALERKNRLMQYIDSYDKFTDVSSETPFGRRTDK
ncbi:MAG: ATP-binding protein, partial [Lachnospiraceae bacterium]|nr:ATP-binding protein [Lachnospiraceae bacterium]